MNKLRNAYIIVEGMKPITFSKHVIDSDLPNVYFTQSYSTDEFQIFVLHKDVDTKSQELLDLMFTLLLDADEAFLVNELGEVYRTPRHMKVWQWVGYARRTRHTPTPEMQDLYPIYKIRDTYTVLGGPPTLPGEMKENF